MELKKGETIMTDASLHLPAAFLHEAFSNRSGVPPDHFELYYRGKRLEGEAVLASWGVGRGSTIEVKMRGRGGTPGGSPGSGKSAAAGGGAADGTSGSDGGGGVEGVRGVGGAEVGNVADAGAGGSDSGAGIGGVGGSGRAGGGNKEGKAALVAAKREISMQSPEEGPSSSLAPGPPSPSKVEPQRKLNQKAKDASEAASTPILVLPEHGGTPGVHDANNALGDAFQRPENRHIPGKEMMEKAATKEAVAEKDAAEKVPIMATVGADNSGVGDAVVPPAHDVDLSKLLTKLLRHKAVELGVAIDADGWVLLSDALVQINGPRLRAFVGNAEKLGSHMYTEADVCTSASHMYTEADVRDVVNANDKRRFVLSDDDTQIRAAQGHDMPGVGEKQGEPLTLETAPEVAVHGSYMKHVQTILEQGLSRMGRHHVHLAKGLLGEKGVVSGMRRDAEVFIWVNVHEAIKGGLTFYESTNGVILCGGKDGDGIIPRAYFSIAIDFHGGSTLKPVQASFALLLLHAIACPNS